MLDAVPCLQRARTNCAVRAALGEQDRSLSIEPSSRKPAAFWALPSLQAVAVHTLCGHVGAGPSGIASSALLSASLQQRKQVR